APRIAAEVRDPAIVGAAVRGRELGVEELRFPQEAERWIEDRLRQSFAIEQLDALLHVHRAERRTAEIRLIMSRPNAAHVFWAHVTPHRTLAKTSCLVDPLPHAPERAELAGTRKLGSAPVDLEVLVTVVAHADPDGAVAHRGLEVLLPEVGRLQDVSVPVDHGRLGPHPPTLTSPP